MSGQPLQYAEPAKGRARWPSQVGGVAGLFATFALGAVVAWLNWRGLRPPAVTPADRAFEALPLLSIAAGLLSLVASSIGLAGNWRGTVERLAFGVAVLYWVLFGAVMLGLV